MSEFFQKVYFNNTISEYLWALGTMLAGFIIVTILKVVFQNRLIHWRKLSAQPTETSIPERVLKLILPLIYLCVLYGSINLLSFKPVIHKTIRTAMLALTMIFITRMLSTLVEYIINKYSMKHDTDSDRQFAMHWVNKLAKGILWLIAIILFVDNLGININAIIAGLGIGGIAIAFAAQAILEDIFSYITIFFDRPFEVGDFITAGEYQGTVEHIGIRTTRLRSIDGEQLVFPNKDLTNSRVKNYKGMEQRRVHFKLNVTYDTPQDKLKAIPESVKAIIERQEDTRFDRAHFASFEEYSLCFDIVYYVLSSDYNHYMDIQQKINFAIKELFEQRNIQFAFPTQTINRQDIQ